MTSPTSPKHFLTLADISNQQLYQLLDRAMELKKSSHREQTLAGKTLTMIFEKSSTRTRLSFETGIYQLGGQAIFLSSNDSQLGRGETIEDSARVISRITDMVMIRTHSHQRLLDFAKHSKAPVINGLTDDSHPCQLLADMLTMYETFATLKDLTVAWVGDSNNMCNSYIEAADLFGFKLNIYTPNEYRIQLNNDVINATPHINITDSVQSAVTDADVVTTDVWYGMGQESEQQQRINDLKDCSINQQIMQQAKPQAIFLHCLPAHRGEEVTNQVIDGSQSKVWQQAENRLHAQKALMELLLA